TIDVAKNLPIVKSFPGTLPDYVIFEQVSNFNGTIRKNGMPFYNLNQAGFSEYTTHKIHTIYGRILNDTEGATVTATNTITGVQKTSPVTADGWYSVDGNFSDYLANETAPWVADGDFLEITAVKGDKIGSTILTVNLSVDRQQASNITLHIKGDFNGNDIVDLGDVTYVAYMIVGKVPEDLSADFNGNGRVDIGDTAKIAYYVAGKISEL
ncbi:MAG: hypothetical protein ACE5KT_05770, partial [Methanosarcinales archaeon]